MSLNKIFRPLCAGIALGVTAVFSIGIDRGVDINFVGGCISDSCSVVSRIGQIQVDSRDNYYKCISSRLFRPGQPDKDFKWQISKYNSSGVEIWSKTQTLDSTITGNGYEFSYSQIALDVSGNIFVCGIVPSSGSYKLLTSKYDNNGNLLWSASTVTSNDGGGESDFISLNFTSSGELVVGLKGGHYTPSVFKYSSKGEFVWSNSLDANIRNIQVSTGDKLYLSCMGKSQNFAQGTLIRLSMDSGTQVWQKLFAVGVGVMAVDAGDNVYSLSLSSLSNGVFSLSKFNSAGNLLWSNNMASRYLESLTPLVVAGNSIWAGLTKYNTNGVQEASITTKYNLMKALMKVDNNGNVVRFIDRDISNGDSATIEIFSSNGLLLGTKMFMLDRSYINKELFIRSLDRLYRVQADAPINAFEVLVIAKSGTQASVYQFPVSGLSTTLESKKERSLLTSFSATPNPATFLTFIRYKMADNTPAVLTVFDITGRMVCSRTISESAKMVNGIALNTQELSAGSYVCQLSAGSERLSLSLKVIH
ncbi:MAG: T9SS type A sorting domain-containing protein [Fibrobacteres bacterium]|nr:T9SS type A sorting domain-containing protein [Fibrobacterota bacterium]